MDGLNPVTVEHDRTTLEFRKDFLDSQEDGYRYAITNIEYTNSGTVLAKPPQLDDLYRTIEAISGNELFRTVPVLTISMEEHKTLIERGFAKYDRLWKELAGI